MFRAWLKGGVKKSSNNTKAILFMKKEFKFNILMCMFKSVDIRFHRLDNRKPSNARSMENICC